MAAPGMTVRRLIAAAVVAVIPACGAGSGGAQAEMEGDAVAATTSRKRAAPADVPPVIREGVRYEVVHWGKARGLPQNGGYLAAVDVASGEERGLIRVYEIDYDPGMEGDKQDVFLTQMRLGCRGECLELEDEQGREYRVDLASFEF